MSLKPNIIYSLQLSRKMLDGLLETLQPPDDWLYQPCSRANHALWVVGHLGVADDRFAARLAGADPSPPDRWDELFWFGSTLHTEAAAYPPIDEVREYARVQRDRLLEVIENVDDSVLESPTPAEGMFADAPNLGQMLFHAAFHEGLHTGQLTVVHRGLGHDPLMKPKPTA